MFVKEILFLQSVTPEKKKKSFLGWPKSKGEKEEES